MAKISYLPDEKVVSVSEEETLLQASLREGMAHVHACGGQAKCTTCRVVVLEGIDSCLPRNEEEAIISAKLALPSDIRLACQTKIKGDVTVRRLIIDQEDIDLVKQMKENTTPVSLGEEKELAILFADIQGFTTFSEKHFSYDVIHVLNRFFQEMERVVELHQGQINNTMGDGFLALFEKENSQEAALNAVEAGLGILKEMEKLNQYLESLYKETLPVRVGIHYGELIMGTIGKRETVIGDSVNLASRIEALNKEMKTDCLISETIYQKVQDKLILGKNCRGSIRGKKGSYQVYEVLGLK